MPSHDLDESPDNYGPDNMAPRHHRGRKTATKGSHRRPTNPASADECLARPHTGDRRHPRNARGTCPHGPDDASWPGGSHTEGHPPQSRASAALGTLPSGHDDAFGLDGSPSEDSGHRSDARDLPGTLRIRRGHTADEASGPCGDHISASDISHPPRSGASGNVSFSLTLEGGRDSRKHRPGASDVTKAVLHGRAAGNPFRGRTPALPEHDEDGSHLSHGRAAGNPFRGRSQALPVDGTVHDEDGTHSSHGRAAGNPSDRKSVV